MVNKVILVGNVGKEPEIRHLESGSALARFSLATNESYKDKSGEWQQVTEWHNIIVWRQLAERAERSVKKGSTLYLEGKLTTRKWQDKDGNDKYTTEVVANTFRVLDRKEAGAANTSYSPLPAQEPFATAQPAATAQAAPTSSTVEEDDLPF